MSKPANAPSADPIEAEVIDPSHLSPEAISRILSIAAEKGIDADRVDRILGAKLADASPSMELEILRMVKVAR